ncbi:hypothetical protein GCM10009733_103260 [Nonomuraea maheshkhaliensis]|uniref:PASTA domain-containing protein n=1 Tax=Nonomuraea maheshkhaliensis TaxID=419590 RepID=A0ABN2HMQ4_9ACTN
MRAIKVTAGAVLGIIALGALVDGCSDRPSYTAATATPTSTWAPEAQTFYAEHRTMPDVRGWSLKRLNKLFDPVRDTVYVAEKTSAKLLEGKSKVTKQEPAAGTKLVEGQTVKLWITVGTRPSPATLAKQRKAERERERDREQYRERLRKAGIDQDRNSHRDRGESRFCSGRWWC